MKRTRFTQAVGAAAALATLLNVAAVSGQSAAPSAPAEAVKIAFVAGQIGITFYTGVECGAREAAKANNVDLNFTGSHNWDINETRPFIAALVTIDDVAFAQWAAERGLHPTSIADLSDADELRAAIQSAVDEANRSVSRAESIRQFTILPRDLTIENDELTPTLKVRRATVQKTYADVIDSLYAV